MVDPHPAAVESARLQSLDSMDILDSPPEEEFDAIVQAASIVCGTPISLISLVDGSRQWFKANHGLPGVSETARDLAFCAHAIHEDGLFEVPDATRDPRFAGNTLVTGEPNIRFYAGVTLRMDDGAHVGTLCVIDRQPRQLDAQQRTVLGHLARAVVRALERRRDTRAKAESEARFRVLSDASPLGVYAADAEGACTYTNARWQTIYGLEQAQSLGNGWTQTLHPDDRAAVFAEWERSAAQRTGFDMAFRILLASGEVRHVRSRAQPVLNARDQVTGYVGTVDDITEPLRVERVLADERQRLQSIIEGTGAGTWEWNVPSGQMRINAQWAGMFGYGLQEIGPQSIDSWRERTHPDDLPQSMALLQRHFAGETPTFECELRMRHREGHWVWVASRGRVLGRAADGTPQWMFGTLVDISVGKAQQEASDRNARFMARTGAVAGVGGWELHVPSGQIIWTEQTCRIHGVAPGYQPQLEEAILFFAPEGRALIQAAMERGMSEGQAWDLELPLLPADGRRTWVRAVGNVEFENGKPLRLYGAFQDITERVEQRRLLEAAHERISLATDSGGIGIWDYDLAGGTPTQWDAWMYRLYGLAVDTPAISFEQWQLLVHPQDRAATLQAVHDAIIGTHTMDIEFRVLWGDGSVHHLRSTARVTRDAQQRALRMVGAVWDVTRLSQLSAELAQQHEQLRVTLQSIGDAVITTDASGCVLWLNPVAERMTGWPTAQAKGRALAQVFHVVNEETRMATENPVLTCLKQGKVVGLANHTLLISRDGDEFGIEDSAAPIRNDRGELLGVVLVFHDVTEQRRLSGEMSYRATHDALTGLVNRGEFEARLRRVLNKAHEDRSAHALMFIDLDQFKLVNDACGHSVGDQLLQQVAKLLTEAVRARDTLARLGGDEFAVILEHCTGEQAQRVAQQVCDRMDDFRFAHEERRFRIGTSIGLVPVDNRWSTTAAIMQAADTSCYAAKEAGRNRVHTWFDTDLAMRARQGEMQWAARLEQALDENRFVLYAQRIEPLLPGSHALHAEVLLRLVDRDGSIVPPGAFLPAAERFHLASRIDRWVLGAAIDCLTALDDVRVVDTLCINLSGQSIGDRAFHRHAIELLRERGAPICKRVCLEITETAAITNMADAAVFIEQVHLLGVRVALDDFGAGASSFGYLKTLSVDLLKIDGQFVEDLIDDPLDDAAVRCFADVARVIGVKTVAEWVETPEILQRLREIGIDYAQGFLLHRPEPIAAVLYAAALTTVAG